ncbi:MAG: 2Fe-2S iron-sulfur cluster binding domain-containing protein, partial [Nanoarchaeota archaeon]
MAKIIFSETKIEIKDGEQIKDACEKLGVPFSCAEGICGTCMIDIIEGQENLSELTQEEKDMGMNKTRRLA